MFTIKIQRASGEEFLIEGARVDMIEGGLLVTAEPDAVLINSHGECRIWGAQTATQLGDPQTSEQPSAGARAYVMNRFGATVATYRL